MNTAGATDHDSFETEADPETDNLEWDALPESAVPDKKPEAYATGWL